jgi:hypothetical protein
VIVYTYYLKPPELNGALVDQQIQAGHRYYNKIIELERARRSRVSAAMSHYADIECLEAQVRALSDEIKDIRKKIKSRRSGERSLAKSTQRERDRISLCTAVRREVYAIMKEVKQRLRNDLDHQREVEAAAEEFRARQIEARAASGCYWGTYLAQEKAAHLALMSPTPPKFRRWKGEGMVAVQAQGGLPIGDLEGGRLIQIALPQKDAWDRRRDRRQRTSVRLRVGSYGRDPIWAEWPLLMHRPLPRDGTIKWAYVLKRRVAGKDRWELQLTLETRPIPSAARGMVAIDVGWRMLEDGCLRVGYCYDGKKEWEIKLQSDVLESFRYVEGLRSVRDRLMNAAIADLKSWLSKTKVPEWIREQTKTLHAWRSQACLAALSLVWRTQRWEGDEEGFEQLEAWRTKDKHLWTWETHQRSQTQRRRRDHYRCVAAELASIYKTIVIERFDLRSMQKHVTPESDRAEVSAHRLQRRDASVSDLRGCIMKAVARRGGCVVEVPAAGTTCICHECGQPVDAKDPASLYRKCASCGVVSDQDAAAARRIYEFGERLDDDGKPRDARIRDYGNGVEVVDGVVGKVKRPARFAKRHTKQALAEQAPEQ